MSLGGVICLAIAIIVIAGCVYHIIRDWDGSTDLDERKRSDGTRQR